jgi:hypothetical protein
MTAKGSKKSSRDTRHASTLDDAMAAADAAMKEAGKAYAAAGLDRSARLSLAESAMHDAGKLAEEAVRTAMAQVDAAMEQMPQHRRGDR